MLFFFQSSACKISLAFYVYFKLIVCPFFLFSDTIILEFKQYAPGSKWRKKDISRKSHREKGEETDGFYGGIRKLQRKDEISIWKRFWPCEVLE